MTTTRRLVVIARATAAAAGGCEYPPVAAWTPGRALVRDRWKLVVASTPKLFDLAIDPGERSDVSATTPEAARALLGSMERK